MTTPDDLESLAVAEPDAGPDDADGRRRRGNRTRESILQAAADLASVKGLEGLTIGTLAGELGMSKSGLFAHFGSKEELQLATIDAARRGDRPWSGAGWWSDGFCVVSLQSRS